MRKKLTFLYCVADPTKLLWGQCLCPMWQLASQYRSRTTAPQPRYSGSLRSVSDMASRRHLRYQLVLPSYQLATNGLRAFSVAGQKLWNSLPRLLHETAYITATFKRSLKTFCYQSIGYYGIQDFGDDALYKFTFYLLTYLFI